MVVDSDYVWIRKEVPAKTRRSSESSLCGSDPDIDRYIPARTGQKGAAQDTQQLEETDGVGFLNEDTPAF